LNPRHKYKINLKNLIWHTFNNTKQTRDQKRGASKKTLNLNKYEYFENKIVHEEGSFTYNVKKLQRRK